MAKIALAPLPEHGHLNPTFKLARSLRQSGHGVCYLGRPDIEEYVGYQGFEFISIYNQAWRNVSLSIDSLSAKDVVNEVGEAFQKSGADLLLLERKELNSFPWDKVDDTKRLIYCSLGSQNHQYN